MSARRAVVRWAVRLFRRDWRQQVLVLTLLSIAVAGTIAGSAAGFNLAAGSEATFGAADHWLKFDASDPAVLDAEVAAARQSFGTIEVIGHRYARVPGSVENVEFRAQDPHGPYGGPMLRLRSGRYPTGPGEVAVTDGLPVDRAWTVVGLVENPANLDDEFALVPASGGDPPESVTILANATPQQFESYREANGSPPTHQSRGTNGKVAAAAGVFGFAAVGLLLVCLVAAAGFAVAAGRRLRQLGMLAAIGATERHLRLVMLANGTVVGIIAALVGTVVGLGCWLAIAPYLETAAGHRIGRFDVPWMLIIGGMVLAVVTATAAAWWPARAAARVPIMLALSARPPRPKPARRSAVAAVLLLSTGITCLVLGDQKHLALIMVGTVATALGILFISPLAIRVLAALGARTPVAVRLALRDLARYQARSGAALAAISLALAIPVAIVITAKAAEHTASEGNLSDRQLIVRVNDPDQPSLIPVHTAPELQGMANQVDRLAATLDRPTVIPLDMVSDRTARPEPATNGGRGGRPTVELGLADSGGPSASIQLYVATPELLAHYGLGGRSTAADVLTKLPSGQYEFVSIPAKEIPATVETINLPGYSSLPGSLVTPDAVRQHDWETLRAGWLVETDTPLTAEQLADARDLAANAGLTIEARRDQRSLATLRWAATAAGMLLALGVLAITVGLIRGESAGDLRTLTATGATSRIRRTLTAATAGALALLGAILGTVGAYLGLIAGYVRDIETLSRVPVLHLTVTAAGLPLLAALAGWLVAGREPPSVARRLLE